MKPSVQMQTMGATETESDTEHIEPAIGKAAAEYDSQPGRLTSRAATMVSHDTSVALTRASNLIRQAMEMDGVVFVVGLSCFLLHILETIKANRLIQ